MPFLSLLRLVPYHRWRYSALIRAREIESVQISWWVRQELRSGMPIIAKWGFGLCGDVKLDLRNSSCSDIRLSNAAGQFAYREWWLSIHPAFVYRKVRTMEFSFLAHSAAQDGEGQLKSFLFYSGNSMFTTSYSRSAEGWGTYTGGAWLLRGVERCYG